MNILVLGGTRFFGKRLVETLIDEGHAITLLTRGQTPDPFGNNVTRLRCLRSDADMMRRCLRGKRYDVVYDHICFSPDDAAITCEIFGRAAVGRYIFISSMYVYHGQEEVLTEGDFNPADHDIRWGSRDVLSYEEGKRAAEVYFTKRADFPVVSVRFPIVMGRDDYTGRFAHYVMRIMLGDNIFLPSPQGRMNYINAQDAAEFLAWLKDRSFSGAVNAASRQSFNTTELVEKFAGVLGQRVCTVTDPGDSDETSYPYYRPDNMVTDISKAAGWGYTFSDFDDWFPQEVAAVKERLLARQS
jgi:nucleoside-diphosphate-sugar epimerase